MTRSSDRPGLAWIACLAAGIATAGCEYQEISRTDPFREWAVRTGMAPDPKKQGITQADLRAFAQTRGHAIRLQSFDGEDRLRLARNLSSHLSKSVGLNDTWFTDDQGIATVYRGQYLDPDLPDAQRDLEQTRGLIVDGWRPFVDAEFVPVGADGAYSPRDLRGYPGMYTLQIAFYTLDMGEDFRKVAEQRAEQLRKEDFDAYFYHGPKMSNVTIGLFTQEEAYERVGPQFKPSAVVRALMKRFPHNEGNGQPIPFANKDGKEEFQESSLVVVPK